MDEERHRAIQLRATGKPRIDEKTIDNLNETGMVCVPYEMAATFKYALDHYHQMLNQKRDDETQAQYVARLFMNSTLDAVSGELERQLRICEASEW